MCIHCMSVCVKNGSFLTFFDCFILCVIRIGLRDVSVVPETELLLEQFFTEANIAKYTHTEVFTVDKNSNKIRLGSYCLKLPLL